MSNDISSVFTNIMPVPVKDLNSFKVANMGVTLIDTNPASGRIEKINGISTPHVWSPINALMLYPIIEDYEKNRLDKRDVDLSMACAWMTGLTPLARGLATPQHMSSNSYNWLKGRAVSTTEQILRSRPDEMLTALFSNMKWYGTNKRIVDNKHMPCDDQITKLIEKGYVSKTWQHDPISVRYVVQILGDCAESYDYIYFIGGSEDIIGDDLELIPKNLSSLYDQIRTIKDELKKTSGKKTEPEDEASKSNPKFLWYAYDASSTNPTVRANILAKKLLRTIEGIIFIRNYLVYAKNGIGISDINEVVGFDESTGMAIYKTVKIVKIIEKYDNIYAYCKNLCYIFKDIGAGDII